MSFGFGLGDFLAVLQIANDLRRRFVDSPKQFSSIADETKSLAHVLQELDDISPARDLDDAQEKNLLDICRTCKAVLNELETELDKYQELRDVPTKAGTRIWRVWKRFTFDAGDFSDLRARLVSNTSLLTAFYSGLTSQDTLHVRHVVDRLETHQDDLARRKIIDWLSNANHRAQYDNLQRMRQPGTGKWLLTSQEFQDWTSCKSRTLFCPGLPGAGKSMSACAVIEHLFSRYLQDSTIGICFLFFEYKRADEQHIDKVLAAILQQLLQGLPVMPKMIQELYRRDSNKSAAEYLVAIREVLKLLRTAFILLDALDEFTNETGQRNSLLHTVFDLQQSSGLQVFATSRFIPEIESQFKGKSSIEVKASDEDVKSYLESQMRLFPTFVQRDPTLQKEISSAVSQKIDGIFLLARLHIESLRFHISATALRVALEALPAGPTAPDTLRKAYDEARSRIEQQPLPHVQLVKDAFSWITYFAEPLTTQQLLHGLAVDSSHVFDHDAMPDIEVLLSSSAGLLTIDEQTEIIGFIHYTTQEYIESIRVEWLPNGPEQIVFRSLWYFALEDLRDFGDRDDRFWANQVEFPLLWPALRSFGTHARGVNFELYKKSAVEFFMNEYLVEFIAYVVSSASRRLLRDDSTRIRTRTLILTTGGSLATYWGLQDLLIELVELGCAGNGYEQGFLLDIAVCEGWVSLVDWLLKRDWSSSALRGSKALCSATLMDRDVIASMLMMDSRIDINSAENSSEETPLLIAVAHRSKAVFKLLISRTDLDVNKRGFECRAPLIEAVDGGTYYVRQLLARPDIKVNEADNLGRTALYRAALLDNSEAVSLLLAHPGIDTSIRNHKGETALDIARIWKSLDCILLLQQHENALSKASRKNTFPIIPRTHATLEEPKSVEQGIINED